MLSMYVCVPYYPTTYLLILKVTKHFSDDVRKPDNVGNGLSFHSLLSCLDWTWNWTNNKNDNNNNQYQISDLFLSAPNYLFSFKCIS